MRKVIYISGPMKMGDRLDNICQADKAMASLMRAGYSVINPVLNFFAGNACRNPGEESVYATAGHEEGEEFDRFSHADWLDCDKAQVARCDAVLRLPGVSKGADIETAFARQLRIPVFTSIDALRMWFEVELPPETAHARSEGQSWRTPASWDDVFMGMAKVISRRSKDPSFQAGAIMVSPTNSVLGVGFNGPPPQMDDAAVPWGKRPDKYGFILHAEENCISDAIDRAGRDKVIGSTLYVNGHPCPPCFLRCIRAGVRAMVWLQSPHQPRCVGEKEKQEIDRLRATLKPGFDTALVPYQDRGVVACQASD